MLEANIGDRSSVERLYPREKFDRDAGENSDAKATVHRGLLIVSGAERPAKGEYPDGAVFFTKPYAGGALLEMVKSPEW